MEREAKQCHPGRGIDYRSTAEIEGAMTTAKLMIKPMFRMVCAVLFSVTALVAGADDGAKAATNAQNNIKDISHFPLCYMVLRSDYLVVNHHDT